jgi:hypothetical protein
MVMFTGGKPGRVPVPPQGTVPPRTDIPDANSGTFYSAMSNIDFEIANGITRRLWASGSMWLSMHF